jgi:hypothetical protein
MLVKPMMAKEWLANANVRNRHIQKLRVDGIVRDIRAGRWQRRNETIAFYIDGTLGDGQHRLSAIVESGIAVLCIVETGYPMDTVFNNAKARSNSDIVTIQGGKNSVLASAACTVLARYALDLDKHMSYTPIEFTEMYLKIQDLLDQSIAVVNQKYSHFRTGTGVAAHFVMSLSAFARGSADAFFHDLATGSGLDPMSPVLALRNRFIGARDERFIIERSTWLWWALGRAWKGYVTGERMSKFIMTQPARYADIYGVQRASVASLLK